VSGKTITVLLLVGVFIVFLLLMNSALLRYRQDEIMYNLDILSQEINDDKSFGLIGRYQLVKKRLAHGGENASDLIDEVRLQQMLQTMESENPVKGKKEWNVLNILADPAVRYYIRGLSYLQGKESPADIYHTYRNPLLELSYFFERNRKWNKALLVMGKLFDKNTLPPEPAYRYILLHSGFCFAMLSRNDEAGNSLYQLIHSFPGTPEAETAQKLLGVLNAVKKGVHQVLAGNAAPEVKGERLYLLSSYTRALQHYNIFFKTADTSHPRFYKSLYFRGRTYEELGDSRHAIEDFREVISKQPGSIWAIKANRRMFMLGTVYGGDKQLIADSIQQSKHDKDEKIFTAINKIHVTSGVSSVTVEDADTQFRRLFPSEEPSGAAIINIPRAAMQHAGADLPGERINAIPGFAEKVQSSIDSWHGGPSEIAPEYWVIITKDGFTLKGIIKHKNEKKLALKTEFGNITLDISSIKSIKKSNQ
jgi:tetratricopeptide (TPR) repeat protein